MTTRTLGSVDFLIRGRTRAFWFSAEPARNTDVRKHQTTLYHSFVGRNVERSLKWCDTRRVWYGGKFGIDVHFHSYHKKNASDSNFRTNETTLYKNNFLAYTSSSTARFERELMRVVSSFVDVFHLHVFKKPVQHLRAFQHLLRLRAGEQVHK